MTFSLWLKKLNAAVSLKEMLYHCWEVNILMDETSDAIYSRS